MYYDEKNTYLKQYQIRSRKDFHSGEELYYFIKNCFPEIEYTPNYGSFNNFVLHFLIFIMHYFSPVVLTQILGEQFLNTVVGGPLARSMKAKKIQGVSFQGADMGARKGYCFTSAGLAGFLSSFGMGNLESPKVRRNGGIVSIHDYGIGLSLLQCMLMEKPMQYNREIAIGATGESYKVRGSICTDLLVTYPIEKKSIYIEQDMGTENTWQLVKKIEDYENLGLLLPNTFLVFSSHSIFDDAVIPGYGVRNLEALMESMKQANEYNVREFYIHYSDGLDDKIKVALESLLCIVGLARGYSPNNKSISLREYKSGCHIQLLTTDKSFLYNDLELYVLHLKEGKNIYRAMIYNQHQDRIARGKFQNICDMIYSRIKMEDYASSIVCVALRGYPLYVLPSMLLADGMQTHIFQDSRDRLFSFIREYYPTLSAESYQCWARVSFDDSHLPGILLKNTFFTSDGTLICFEHIGKDIGGFIRGAYLLHATQKMCHSNYRKIHFIGICDTLQETRNFCHITEYYSLFSGAYSEIPGYLDVFASFVYSYELYPGKKLMAMLNGDSYYIEKEKLDLSNINALNLISL